MPTSKDDVLFARRFVLRRTNDVTGISGTGDVADGVIWPDGTASVRWRGEHPSITFWDRGRVSIEFINGHINASTLEFHDPEQPTGPARPASIAAEPVHDALWSLLDWSFWSSGMGDVLRQGLADTMTGAITAEDRATALRVMQAWTDSGRTPIGRWKYEAQQDEIKELRAQLAAADSTVDRVQAELRTAQREGR